MPLFNLKCQACKYELEDVLCTYIEALGKKCPKCEDVVMHIVPAGKPAVRWTGDTDFSVSGGKETT
jgi:phage FluMu protein Com